MKRPIHPGRTQEPQTVPRSRVAVRAGARPLLQSRGVLKHRRKRVLH